MPEDGSEALCHDIKAIYSNLISHVMLPHPLDRKLTPSFQSMAELRVAERDCKLKVLCIKERRHES